MNYSKSKEEYIKEEVKDFQVRIDSYQKNKNVEHKRFVDNMILIMKKRIDNMIKLSDEDYQEIVDSQNNSDFSEQLTNIGKIIIKGEKNQLSNLSYSELIDAEKMFIKYESLINKGEFDRTKKGIQQEIRFRKLNRIKIDNEDELF